MSTTPPTPEPQAVIDAEMARIQTDADKALADGGQEELQPRRDYPPYRSSDLRHPKRPLVAAREAFTELRGPVFGVTDVTELDSDLTRQHHGEPLGERIVVTGRVLDRDGRPVRGQLVEIWQANAAGRYAHKRDQHPAPLDPNFTGTGRCLTDDEGRYTFTSIKPGAYPWRNHQNAWRPAHIHFSLFGTAFTQRLVTQLYFPGDPLLAYDPIFNSITDERARQRLSAVYDHDLSSPEWSLGYRWDIVLDGPSATWMEEGR
ncbi:protocatechuate 3,4-dioxygenase subunit beta [Microtetraspora sp. NBRC 16547]|uniref:protocatechuate 3,4-dioxygenase subunit beta n=1 Tax=Microtetraspora sp. NBRC 16547 TaxID=3030993 RepID=UPI0024A33D7D|nr:protocatechuate 3,4-dioxygenase subunit beta [Microtetraspora sp. NBRC 16547]GLX01686.1 protocatechuate 3,4-dioxygenase subunit beta [Microtetraspora sp. NBRC 16547]